MGIDLAAIWCVLIVIGIFMYVVMDGFDLGIGILFPFIRSRQERDVMMNTVAPVWDGNETWLVLGGAGLLASFPMAYSVILSAIYLPIILMLAGLILRGVAFEFRFSASSQSRHYWDKAFIAGSVIATFMQGVILGALLTGIDVEDGQFAGGGFDWLSAFSLFTGFALLTVYALLGSTWLIMKTDGALQQCCRKLAEKALGYFCLALIAVSILTPLSIPSVSERWFSSELLPWLVPVPLVVIAALWKLHKVVKGGSSDLLPFSLTLLLVFVGYSGLVISFLPVIIPPGIDIWQAAGSDASLGFSLVGALFILPFILGYTAWSYYVFRGKVTADSEGYH